MADEQRNVDLYGRVFLSGAVKVVTGLHIGGATGALNIGGMDNPVIRDPLTNQPYLPGSSLKGKMRSLTEKLTGAHQTFSIGQGVRIHVCQARSAYASCPVCPVFGTVGNSEASAPTRLVVRDAFLDAESAAQLERARTDLPYTEVKWEAAIDRVTSAATPRQVERVPAGAVFRPFEIIYSIYEGRDLDNFPTVVRALQLVEDDYLGGLGSRGGGQVRFTDLELFAKARAGYERPDAERERRAFATLGALLAKLGEALDWLRGQVPVG